MTRPILVAIIPLVAYVIGLLMWRPKIGEAGKQLAFCGLLITLAVLASYTVKL